MPHLHVILQDAIYHELRTVAARQHSQLIVATHSEVIMNTVEPRELCITLDEPRMIADTQERTRLISSLRVLSNADVMQALGRPRHPLCRGLHGHRYPACLGRGARTPGIEAAHDRVDGGNRWSFKCRREASVVGASRQETTSTRCSSCAKGFPGSSFETVMLGPKSRIPISPGPVCDGFAGDDTSSRAISVHPDALVRFVESVGRIRCSPRRTSQILLTLWRDELPPAVVRRPLGDHEYLNVTKARTRLLSPLLEEAGLHGLPYTRYHEIAALMYSEEIHPEVVEKLDAICRASRCRAMSGVRECRSNSQPALCEVPSHAGGFTHPTAPDEA